MSGANQDAEVAETASPPCGNRAGNSAVCNKQQDLILNHHQGAWDLGNELDGVGPFVGAGGGRAHDCKGPSAKVVSELIVLENNIFSPVD